MTAVKWAIFVVAALASLPAGRWLRRRSQVQLQLWTVVGFLPFVSSLDMGLIAWRFPGDTHGLEVAVLDWFALALLLAQERRAKPLPYRLVFATYLLVTLVSVTQADFTLGAFGYVWKLGRVYLVYAAVCRAAAHDERVPAAVIRGLAFGIVYEAAWTVWQHFGLHIHRAMGTFAHENTLGMLVNLIVMAPVALLFAGRTSKLTWLAPVAAIPISLFTVSRGTILFLGAGSALVYFLSVYRRYTNRKAMIGVLGLVLAAVIIPVALTTLSSRSRQEQEESMEVRRSYERAASVMLADHPLGVGPNHFALKLFAGGYGERAGVDWSQRVAIVHNIYWLTLAEMGYAGFVALVVLFLTPLVSAMRWSLRARRDPRGDVLLGLGVALLMFYAHGFFEWASRLTEVSYVYFMTVGMVASLARQVREAELRRRVAVRRGAIPAAPVLRSGGAAPVTGP